MCRSEGVQLCLQAVKLILQLGNGILMLRLCAMNSCRFGIKTGGQSVHSGADTTQSSADMLFEITNSAIDLNSTGVRTVNDQALDIQRRNPIRTSQARKVMDIRVHCSHCIGNFGNNILQCRQSILIAFIITFLFAIGRLLQSTKRSLFSLQQLVSLLQPSLALLQLLGSTLQLNFRRIQFASSSRHLRRLSIKSLLKSIVLSNQLLDACLSRLKEFACRTGTRILWARRTMTSIALRALSITVSVSLVLKHATSALTPRGTRRRRCEHVVASRPRACSQGSR